MIVDFPFCKRAGCGSCLADCCFLSLLENGKRGGGRGSSLESFASAHLPHRPDEGVHVELVQHSDLTATMKRQRKSGDGNDSEAVVGDVSNGAVDGRQQGSVVAMTTTAEQGRQKATWRWR